MIDKSKLMKTAWKIAKRASRTFNDSVNSFFPESLKHAWKIMTSTVDIEDFKKIEEEIDDFLYDSDGGTWLYSDATEFEITSSTMPFDAKLYVKIDGTIDLTKTRLVKGKEHCSFLNANIDRNDGSTETLFETYIAKTYKWTDVQDIKNTITAL